jgi:hypothetical protein
MDTTLMLFYLFIGFFITVAIAGAHLFLVYKKYLDLPIDDEMLFTKLSNTLIPFIPVYVFIGLGIVVAILVAPLEYSFTQLIRVGAFWLLLSLLLDIIAWFILSRKYKNMLKNILSGKYIWLIVFYLTIFLIPLISLLL